MLPLYSTKVNEMDYLYARRKYAVIVQVFACASRDFIVFYR